MPLLNYTTKINADRSIAEIQKKLAIAGASAILAEYEEGTGQILALSFRIKMGDQELSFRLPTDWKPVQKVLEQQRVAPQYRTQDHARSVAWRITKDWVEAQLAILETKMVTLGQLFLPYAITKDGNTLSEKIAADPSSLQLGDGK